MVLNVFDSRIKRIIFSGLFLFSIKSQAFINIESLRQVEGAGFLGKTTLQISGQQGNTDKFTSQFSSMGVFRDNGNEWLYTGSYKYGTSAGLRDTNLGSGHIRHTWGFLNPLAYEAFVQSGFDEFKKLNARNYVGANLRFRMVHTDKHRLYSGAGAFYEVEDFMGESEDREGVRGNFYLSYVNRLNEILSSSTTVYYQPKFKEVENYRVRLQTGLDVRLTQRLSLDVDFNLTHDTSLPADVKTTDIDYLLGFSVSY